MATNLVMVLEGNEMLNPSDYDGDLKTIVVVFSDAMKSLVKSVDEIKATLVSGFDEIKRTHATVKDIEHITSRIDAQSRRIDGVESTIGKVGWTIITAVILAVLGMVLIK